MPIYEFVCEACGRLVELIQKLSDPPPEACPECGGKMAKIMSRNSFQLKGGGWYRDLYSSSSGGTGSGSPGTGGSTAEASPSGAAKGTASPAPASTESKPASADKGSAGSS